MSWVATVDMKAARNPAMARPRMECRQIVVHHQHEADFRMGEAGVKDDDGEGGENPGPGANGVVSDVEPEDTEQALALVAGGEDALGDISAATGFGSGIPEGPPLQADVDEEGCDGDGPEHLRGESGGETGEEGERIAGGRRVMVLCIELCISPGGR